MKTLNENQNWLYSLPIAHRGYYDKDNPENTEPAYLLAVENGYAIETDVQMTADNHLVCIHDSNMKRICKVDVDIRDLTLEEVKKLRPFDKDLSILTFEEFLKLVDGRVPVMIEVKPQKRCGVESLIINALDNYSGKFALQSFDPFIVRKLKKLSPNLTVGMLITLERFDNLSKFENFLIQKTVYLYLLKLDFVNVRISDLEKLYKRIKRRKILTWTITNQEQLKIAEKYALNVTFEKQVGDLGKFKI